VIVLLKFANFPRNREATMKAVFGWREAANRAAAGAQ
jgi:hypothetical protein